ncbi:hypothetical protein J7T55_007693 [Diaporthe amygdali]|uniref:uncharacterized protein n=1 Tax=Phomopsis amygdali TaxID=1214568 RepID=UPI0022FE1702|nr:uncharacterized protein J7T55_007693 [Diaporthe amygdali]KAJ0107504.1 hypothetical protein J7T55_007693 [Diaporthe amygdali]
MASTKANATTADVVGWTTGPGTRGTLTLVWSCVITIFACTWTVLHLNVPGRKEASLWKTLRKVKWMAINILFPEFIFAKAVCDLRLALEELREFDENVRKSEKHCKWTVPENIRRKSHEWSWDFEYPLWADWLYRLLRLDPPRQPFKQKSPPPWILKLCDLLHFRAKSTDNPVAARQSYLPDDTEITQRSSQRDSQKTTRSILQCDQKADVKSDNQSDVQPEVQSSSRRLSTGADFPEPKEVNSVQHDPDVASTEAHEQDDQSQMQEETLPVQWRTVQKWTVVHSYYAQMGGILYPDNFRQDNFRQDNFRQVDSSREEPRYQCLTASMLTLRYSFHGDKHPFDHLILTEQDVKDKSKADWVLKGIAVAQIAWLILSVTVRSIMDFPIAQLEIATISFAFIAILSYVANWWKPKDISHATILPTFCWGYEEDKDRSLSSTPQPFMLRLWSPTKAAEKALFIQDDLPRVPNDYVWMEGDSPLVFFLMAISSLGFGGLHCLAWNFEFPTQTELLCWRIASVTSAILPSLTLGISLAINFLATSYTDSQLVSILLRKLEPLGKAPTAPTEWWQLMTQPDFLKWKYESQKLLIRTPGERDWLHEPSAKIIEKQRDSEPEDFPYFAYRIFFHQYECFHEYWDKALSAPDPSSTAALCQEWLKSASNLKKYSEDGPVDFWREYEAFITSTRGSPISTPDLRETTYIDFLLQVCGEVSEQNRDWKFLSNRASNFLTIGSGVLYTAARLINLVLMFTCLRRAPVDTYQVTPWLELLPNFS